MVPWTWNNDPSNTILGHSYFLLPTWLCPNVVTSWNCTEEHLAQSYGLEDNSSMQRSVLVTLLMQRRKRSHSNKNVAPKKISITIIPSSQGLYHFQLLLNWRKRNSTVTAIIKLVQGSLSLPQFKFGIKSVLSTAKVSKTDCERHITLSTPKQTAIHSFPFNQL